MKNIQNKITVVHLTTAISHSSAPLRIHEAVQEQGIDSYIVTMDSKIDSDHIEIVPKNLKYKVKNKINGQVEKEIFSKYCDRTNLPFSIGRMGVDVNESQMLKKADIIHLHWINGNFISIKEINKVAKYHKPIVWTFHDSWPMTGGCHVRYGCQKFETGCGDCVELNSHDTNDLSRKVMLEKKACYPTEQIVTVAPSEWMNSNICKSMIFASSKHRKISNPIDTELFTPIERKVDDEKITLLFGASGVLELEYKGYKYFVQAMQYLLMNKPSLCAKINIKIFGSNRQDYPELEGFKYINCGIINSNQELAQLYAESDIYVFPSLDDNFPGTVLECLACGTPVVAFDTCGVPELVRHKKNGYLAEFKNAIDLAVGIEWIIENNISNCLGKEGRQFVSGNFNKERIGKQYKELYEKLFAEMKGDR